MIGIAVLGAGFAGSIQLGCWQRITGVRLVGAYDPDSARLQAAHETFGVKAFNDLEELLAARDVDAVDIATPVETHRALARRAAAQGKAILCQKPLATTYPEALALVEDCERAGVRLMVNENYRWRPWYRAARKVIDEQQLGRLTYMRLAQRVSHAVPSEHIVPGSVLERRAMLFRTQSRLILLELGPHALDLARYLFGDPESVFARTLTIPDYAAGELMVSLSLGFSDRLADVDLSWASVIEPDFLQADILTLEGTEGTLRLSTAGTLTLIRRSGTIVPIALDLRDFYQRSWEAPLRHFAACLTTGASFETSGRQNLKTIQLIFDAYESARSQQVVTVEAK